MQVNFTLLSGFYLKDLEKQLKVKEYASLKVYEVILLNFLLS